MLRQQFGDATGRLCRAGARRRPSGIRTERLALKRITKASTSIAAAISAGDQDGAQCGKEVRVAVPIRALCTKG